MARRQLAVIGLVLTLVASACTGSTDEPRASSTSATPRVPASDLGLADALTAVGVAIIDDPASAPAMAGLQLWSWQVENMELELEAGGGFLGTQLDQLVGSPGGLPFSYLLAGWMDSAVTPSAVAAAELMGDQPLDQAPSLGYPTAVLVLFVADALQAASEDQRAAMPAAMLVSAAQGGVCSTLAGWVSSALDFVFNALKVEVEGSGFFSWLGIIWNTAVDLARDAVVGVIKTLTAPVVSLIQDALAVVGVLSMTGSLLSRWWIDVDPSTKAFRLPVGDEPTRKETFTARVDTKIKIDWDDYIVDCARVANLDLPDPSSAAGSAVRWEVTSFPEFGTLKDSDAEIDENNEATLDWESAREETRDGDSRTGYVWAHATVVNDEFENLKSMVWGWISGKISGIPFEEQVKEGIGVLIEPILERLVRLVEFRGQGGVAVIYHIEDPSAGVTITILDPDTECEATTPDDPAEWHRIGFENPPPFGDHDSVPYLVRVDGLTPEKAEDLVLKVSADELRVFVESNSDGEATINSKIEPIPITNGGAIDEDSWRFEGTVPLGYDLITDAFQVWAWINFTAGGQSSDEEIFIAVDVDELKDVESCHPVVRTYPASLFQPDIPLKITYQYLEGKGGSIPVSSTVTVAWDGESISKTFPDTDLRGFLDAPTDMRIVRGPDFSGEFCDIGSGTGCAPLAASANPDRFAFFPGGLGGIPRFWGGLPSFEITETREHAGRDTVCGTGIDPDWGEVELCIEEATGAVLYAYTVARCADPDRTDFSCVEVEAVRIAEPLAADFAMPSG